VEYVLPRHEQCGGELVCLILDLLHTPDLVAVHHEVPELVRGIKSGTRTVILFGTQHDNRVIGKRQREAVNVRTVKRQTDHQYPVIFQSANNVSDGSAWHPPLDSHLPGQFFDLVTPGPKVDRQYREARRRKTLTRRRNSNVVCNMGKPARPPALCDGRPPEASEEALM
jgi:hypothetical protein